MNGKTTLWLCSSVLNFGLSAALALTLILLVAPMTVAAQDAAPASQLQPATAKALGTVTAITGQTITLKTDAGAEMSVTVLDSTKLLQLKPGQKDLKD